MISSLKIINLNCFEEEEFFFKEDFNLIHGPSGCGKSTIRMAIIFLYTGRTSLGSQSTKFYFRNPDIKMSVKATVGSGDIVCRTQTPSGVKSITVNGDRVKNDEFEKMLPASWEVFTSIFYPKFFFNLSMAKKRELVLNLFDEIDYDSYARTFLGDHFELAKQLNLSWDDWSDKDLRAIKAKISATNDRRQGILGEIKTHKEEINDLKELLSIDNETDYSTLNKEIDEINKNIIDHDLRSDKWRNYEAKYAAFKASKTSAEKTIAKLEAARKQVIKPVERHDSELLDLHRDIIRIVESEKWDRYYSGAISTKTFVDYFDDDNGMFIELEKFAEDLQENLTKATVAKPSEIYQANVSQICKECGQPVKNQDLIDELSEVDKLRQNVCQLFHKAFYFAKKISTSQKDFTKEIERKNQKIKTLSKIIEDSNIPDEPEVVEGAAKSEKDYLYKKLRYLEIEKSRKQQSQERIESIEPKIESKLIELENLKSKTPGLDRCLESLHPIHGVRSMALRAISKELDTDNLRFELQNQLDNEKWVDTFDVFYKGIYYDYLSSGEQILAEIELSQIINRLSEQGVDTVFFDDITLLSEVPTLPEGLQIFIAKTESRNGIKVSHRNRDK